MRSNRLLEVSFVLASMLIACSSSDGATPDPDDAGAGASDAGDGGAGDSDGGCAECAWFPSTCSKGMLCVESVEALDPRTVLFALDARGGEVTAVGTYGSVVDRTAGPWRRSGVGPPDALRGVTTLGGETWAASSAEGVFIGALTDGKRVWTEHKPGGPDYYAAWNWAVTALFSEPAGTWVWATTATTCSPMTSSDGVGLVRLRRKPEWLELEKVIQHKDLMSTCITMNALDGAGGALWVAGDRGVVYKVTDLEATTPVVSPESSGTMRSLLGLWAEASGHVFAVGREGTVLHRAPGGAFVPMGEGVPPVAYHAVRGTSPSDVWIAGEGATVMHFDGKAWSRVPIAGLGDRRPTLRAIAALAPDHVVVAGDNVLLDLAKEDRRAP